MGRVKLALALVYGSYARGDFNEWSDIDVLLVVEDNLPRNPLEETRAYGGLPTPSARRGATNTINQ